MPAFWPHCPRHSVHYLGWYCATTQISIQPADEAGWCTLCRLGQTHLTFSMFLERRGQTSAWWQDPQVEQEYQVYLCLQAEQDALALNAVIGAQGGTPFTRISKLQYYTGVLEGQAWRIMEQCQPLQTLFPGEFIDPISPTPLLQHLHQREKQWAAMYSIWLHHEIKEHIRQLRRS